MEQERQPKHLTPEPIFELFHGYWGSATLKAVADYDIFTLVAEGKKTVEAISGAIGAPLRSTRILLNGLVALQLLTKTQDEYHLTALADTFLVKGREGYIGGLSGIFMYPTLWEAMGKLTEAVKTGTTPLTEHAETPSHPFWEFFSTASWPFAKPGAEAVAEALGIRMGSDKGLRVLDLACGSGFYGLTLLERDRRAHLTFVDWEPVLAVPRERAQELGLADRVSFRPGGLFEVDYGSGYDVVILSQVYHHFSLEKAAVLTRKAYQALKPGGKIAIHDFIPDEERAQKPFPLLFAVLMLAWTPQGDTYTFSEYEALLQQEGFHGIILHEPPELLSQIIVAEK